MTKSYEAKTLDGRWETVDVTRLLRAIRAAGMNVIETMPRLQAGEEIIIAGRPHRLKARSESCFR